MRFNSCPQGSLSHWVVKLQIPFHWHPPASSWPLPASHRSPEGWWRGINLPAGSCARPSPVSFSSCPWDGMRRVVPGPPEAAVRRHSLLNALLLQLCTCQLTWAQTLNSEKVRQRQAQPTLAVGREKIKGWGDSLAVAPAYVEWTCVARSVQCWVGAQVVQHSAPITVFWST